MLGSTNLLKTSIRRAYSTSRALRTFGIESKAPHPIPSSTTGTAVEVQGYYCSRGFDLRKLSQAAKYLPYAHCPKHLDSKSLTFTMDSSKNQHITIFNYGSVVLFNIPKEDHQGRK